MTAVIIASVTAGITAGVMSYFSQKSAYLRGYRAGRAAAERRRRLGDHIDTIGGS